MKKLQTKPSIYELEKIRKKDQEMEAKLREIVPGWLNQFINVSNGIAVSPPDTYTSYKFYIGMGNGGAIIKNALKERGGWV